MILRDILRMLIPFFAGFDLMVFLSVIFKIFFMERFVHPNQVFQWMAGVESGTL